MKKYLLATAVVIPLGITNINLMEKPDFFEKQPVPEARQKRSALTEALQLASFQAILEEKLKRTVPEEKKALLRAAFKEALVSFKELYPDLKTKNNFLILFDLHYRGVSSPVSES